MINYWIEMPTWVKEIIKNLIYSSATSGLIFWIFKGYINNSYQKSLEKRKFKFNKELEDIKADLTKEIDTIKFHQSLMFKEFELLATKKYEHYPELYKRIELCIGKVMNLRGVARKLTFKNVGKEDVEGYMKGNLFTIQDTTEILDLWETRKEEAIKIKS